MASKFQNFYYSDFKNIEERVYLQRIAVTEGEVNLLKVHKCNKTVFVGFTSGVIDCYQFIRAMSVLLRPSLKIADSFNIFHYMHHTMDKEKTTEDVNYNLMVIFFLFHNQ